MKSHQPSNNGGKPEWRAHELQLDVEIIDPADGQPKRAWVIALSNDHSEMIVAKLFFRKPCPEDYEVAVRSAMNEWPALPETIHTDNQKIYCSSNFQKEMAKLGTRPSTSEKARAQQNGRVERSFRELAKIIMEFPKSKSSDPKPFADVAAEFKKFIDDYNSRLGT